jgi:hypothetical protein
VEDAAKGQSNKRHNEALNPRFCEFKKPRRYKAGDKGSNAEVAEERCSELYPFVVN